MARLDALVYEALTHALDQSTNQAYDSHLQSYLQFCKGHHLPVEPTTQTLARYIVYMGQFIKPLSVETYLSGITHRLRPFFPQVKAARDNDYIKQVLRGTKRLQNSPTNRKEPITFDELNALTRLYEGRNNLDDRLFIAILTAGFFGLMRLGELTDSDDPRLINRRKTIRWDSVTISANNIRFLLPSSKTDRFFQGNHVLLCRNNCFNDPVNAFTRYLEQRDNAFPNANWLWLNSHGEPPSRRWFLSRFHLYFDHRFGGHSLRSGGATLLAKKRSGFQSDTSHRQVVLRRFPYIRS